MRGEEEVVLVTGSAGFIGRRLVERLAERHAVVGFDHEGHSRHPPPVAECVCVDLTDEDKLAAAVARVEYAYGKRLASVVHLAAYYDFSGQPSAKYDEITVGGTRKLVEALRGFEVEQLVFSSTMLVHRPNRAPGERIDEETPLAPNWPYPESKVNAERLLHDIRGDVPVCVLRIAGVYDDGCHSIPLAHQMQRIYEDSPLSHVFPGNLEHGQSFGHVEDTTRAIELAIDRRHELPVERAFLIGEPETVPYGELQDLFAEGLHGRPWETREIPKALAKAGAWLQDVAPGREPFIKPFMIDIADDHYELDVTRARRELGWTPRRSLREAVPRMTAALHEDPVGFYRANQLEGQPPRPAAPQEKPPAFRERA